MAYDKKKLLEKAKEIIKGNEHVYFIEDVVTLLPCSKPTFYDFYPVGSNEMNDIKALLDNNRVDTKIKLRQKLGQSEKEVGILALYKLIGTEEERKRLSQTYQDVTTNGKDLEVKGFMTEGFED